MKGRKTVLFDLDGVLFRTETVDIVAVNKALSSYGYPLKSEEEILECIGITLQEMCEKFGITDSEVSGPFMRDVIRFEQEEIEQWGLMYDGAPEFINRLKRKGYTLCICSNGSHDYVHAIINKFQLAEAFDEIWAQREGFSKSRAVACLAEKYNDGSFIMVGDRSIDIDAGRDSGGITIGTLYGFGGNEPYAADYTAGSIAELEQVIESIF